MFRSDSEGERLALNFMDDYKRQTGKTIQAVNADNPDGISLAELYDVADYPAIITMTDDGTPLQIWQGSSLPTIDTVSYYANGAQ